MKAVTLFSLKSERVLVSGDRLELRRFDNIEPLSFVGKDGHMQFAQSVKTISLPVDQITRITHGRHEDELIALDPELREILEAPVKSRIDRLELDLACRKIENETFELRIDAFNKLPWYKRLFARP